MHTDSQPQRAATVKLWRRYLGTGSRDFFEVCWTTFSRGLDWAAHNAGGFELLQHPFQLSSHGVQHAGFFPNRKQAFPADFDNPLEFVGAGAEMSWPHRSENAMQIHELFDLCKCKPKLLIPPDE